eukprot:m.111589 g.111589  ORF g.111589 m.111589 type:complete len:601 (-) comp12765_c3_seq3:128-1930(-)
MSKQNLPFLPGNSFDKQTGSARHKKQNLSFANGVAVVLGDSDKAPPQPSVMERTSGGLSQQPAWIAFDKQVLCFDAFFKEAVHEARREHYRVRKCKIYFFPQDDTIEIIEPRSEDSGLPQGKLLRRHRIPKPPPADDDFYRVEDINVGEEFHVYGRTFMVTDCDKFTRSFLTKLGIAVGDPMPLPEDPYSKHREKQKQSAQPLRPYERQDKLKQFLHNDRKVLRFFCLWDDSQSEFGDKRFMVMHYFLADDTVEIREELGENSGRDGSAVFLRRQRLPKDPKDHVKAPGTVTNRTLLNVFTPEGLTGRYILDNLHVGSGESEFFTDKDFEIGTEFSVFGRKMLVCDMDGFSKAYYKEKYGIEDFTPIDVDEEKEEAPRLDLPPHSGFGSEEDSLTSVNQLIPKPPKKDFQRWFKEGNNSLQFKAVFETDDPVDKDRQFAINFFLADNSMAIFENKLRNSGISGGKFLERTKVRVGDGSRLYSPSDFYIGATIEVYRRKFCIVDASDFALRFMEESNFPLSDRDGVVAETKQTCGSQMGELFSLLEPLAAEGVVSLEDFESVFIENASIAPQLARTLARAIGGSDVKQKGVSLSAIQAALL